MRMTTDAQAWLDERVRRMLEGHPAAEPQRPGLRYELMSHLHAAAEREAAARGRDEVTRADLEDALERMGGEAALARAFLRPPGPAQRAGFAIRLGAFALDALVLYFGIMLLWTAFFLVLSPLLALAGLSMGGHAPDPFQLFDHDDFPWMLLARGHVTFSVLVGMLLAGVALAVTLGYFTWFESRGGRTLGKRVLGLRAVRADGGALGVREALLRNVVKALPPLTPLLVVDALFIFYEDARLRASDRILGTVVVRDGAPAPQPQGGVDATP